VTECSRCGDCCERIHFSGDWGYLQEWVDWKQSWYEWAMHNLRDGEDGGLWDELTPVQAATLANADFLTSHWTPIPEDAGKAMPRFQCSAFDPATRLCTAHDSRPPICSGYPWYGSDERPTRRLWSHRCSFWADVPLEDRPGGNLRALPVLA
jgi:Fe-S-cluster containining protein